MWPKFCTGVLAACCVTLTIALVRGDGHEASVASGVTAFSASGPLNPSDSRKLLAQPLSEVSLDAVPFEEALELLARRAHVTIDVRWKQVESAGIERSTPVTLHLRKVTSAQALAAILKEVGGAAASLGYSEIGGVIVVTTAEDVRYETVTVVYNVRDLIELTAFNALTRTKGVETLLGMITGDILPESWRDRGGRDGDIVELSGLLVVTHTAEVQERIVHFLERLRAADRERPFVPDSQPSARPNVETPSGPSGR